MTLVDYLRNPHGAVQWENNLQNGHAGRTGETITHLFKGVVFFGDVATFPNKSSFWGNYSFVSNETPPSLHKCVNTLLPHFEICREF